MDNSVSVCDDWVDSQEMAEKVDRTEGCNKLDSAVSVLAKETGFSTTESFVWVHREGPQPTLKGGLGIGHLLQQQGRMLEPLVEKWRHKEMVFYAQCSREKDESWSGDAALFLQWTVIDTRKETLHDLLEPFESASPSDSLGSGLTTVEVGSAKEYQTVVAKALIHASYPKIESGLSCFTFTGVYSGYTRTFCFPFGTASEGLIRSSVHRHLVASTSEETYVWDRCFDRVCGCILSLGEKVSFPLVISASHGEDPRMEIRVSRICVEVHGWKELRYSATPEKRSVGTDTEHLYDPSEHSVVTPHRNTSDSIDPQEALFAHQNKLFDRAHHAVMECGLFRLRPGHNEGKEGSTDDNPLSEMTVSLAIEEACVEEETARIRIETSWLETCIKLKVSLLTDLRRLGDLLVEPNQEIKIRCVSRLPSKEELKLHQTFNHVTKENLTYFTKMKEVEAMLTQVEQEKDAYNAKFEAEYSSLLDTLEELQSTYQQEKAMEASLVKLGKLVKMGYVHILLNLQDVFCRMQHPGGETLLNLKAQRTEPPSWSKLYVTALRERRGTDEDDEGQGSLMDVHLTFVSQALAYLELHPDGGEHELSNENLRMIQNVCQTFGRVAQLSEVNSVSESDLLQYITELTHQWHIEQNRRL